jgi:hypothetical protein
MLRKKGIVKSENNLAITITFSECVENHHGMQKIGEILD